MLANGESAGEGPQEGPGEGPTMETASHRPEASSCMAAGRLALGWGPQRGRGGHTMSVALDIGGRGRLDPEQPLSSWVSPQVSQNDDISRILSRCFKTGGGPPGPQVSPPPPSTTFKKTADTHVHVPPQLQRENRV